MAMRVLDLFSGIGGFSLGLERAGMQTVGFCEIDKFCQKVLQKHWPDIPIHDDIKTLRGDEYGAVDVICGGFPCQDISSARGKGAKGISGEKSGLWKEYARIIGQARPRYVVVENSSMLLTRGLGDLLRDLAALGYDATWHCIPASAIGAPHERDRIWIIAYPSKERESSERWAAKLSEEMAKNIADANSNRFERSHILWEWCFSTTGRFWQEAIPPILGMGDGSADWPHRIEAIGNSVVPQIVEIIGRCILMTEKEFRDGPRP